MASMKRKTPPVKVARPVTKRSAKATIKPRVSEANTSVSTVSRGATAWNTDVVEISSDSDKAEDEDGNEEEDEDWDQGQGENEKEKNESEEQTQTSGQATRNATAMANGPPNNEPDEVSDDEPTFGDLVRDQGTVDVPAMLNLIQEVGVRDIVLGNKAGGVSTETKRSPNLASLSHLLNAALRNNDDANLEVCFGTTSNTTWVRNTIQRMDPALAGPLLQKLAARMYRRPGRAQTLIGWVQWTLITHGGALASQPGVTQSLQELHRVLEERARGLNSLLLLKGKLDMLDAQMQLRRSQRGSTENISMERPGGARGGFMKEDTVAVYIEAKEEAAAAAGQILVTGAAEGVATIGGVNGEDDEDQGVTEMEEEEESSEDDDDEGDEEGDIIGEINDSGIVEENEVDFDDVDDEEEEDGEEEDNTDRDAVPPEKVYKKSAGGVSMRR